MLEKDRYKFEQYLRRNYPKMFIRPFSAIKKTDYSVVDCMKKEDKICLPYNMSNKGKGMCGIID